MFGYFCRVRQERCIQTIWLFSEMFAGLISAAQYLTFWFYRASRKGGLLRNPCRNKEPETLDEFKVFGIVCKQFQVTHQCRFAASQ